MLKTIPVKCYFEAGDAHVIISLKIETTSLGRG